MPKEYVDFFIKKFNRETAIKLAAYGFKHACVVDMVNNFGYFLGLRVYRKILVEASTRWDVLEALRNSRKKVVTSIKPLTREALMTSCRDERVATVLLHGEIAEFDRHVAEVIQNPVEVSISELVECVNDEKKWKALTSFIRKAYMAGVKIVLSSGASQVDEILPPNQLAYVAAALTQRKNHFYDAVSLFPLEILKEKLGEEMNA